MNRLNTWRYRYRQPNTDHWTFSAERTARMEAETLRLHAPRLAQPTHGANLGQRGAQPMSDPEEDEDPDRDEPDNQDDYVEGQEDEWEDK